MDFILWIYRWVYSFFVILFGEPFFVNECLHIELIWSFTKLSIGNVSDSILSIFPSWVSGVGNLKFWLRKRFKLKIQQFTVSVEEWTEHIFWDSSWDFLEHDNISNFLAVFFNLVDFLGEAEEIALFWWKFFDFITKILINFLHPNRSNLQWSLTKIFVLPLVSNVRQRILLVWWKFFPLFAVLEAEGTLGTFRLDLVLNLALLSVNQEQVFKNICLVVHEFLLWELRLDVLNRVTSLFATIDIRVIIVKYNIFC